PRTTQQNLTSVLAQVNLEQPRSSPLLTKAVSVHGNMGQAPLSGRQMPAYHALEEWVNLTRSNNASPHDQPIQPAADGSAKSKPEQAVADKPTSACKTEGGSARATDKGATKEPVDPFDPVIFS